MPLCGLIIITHSGISTSDFNKRKNAVKTLKEKCQQFVLEQILTEVPKGKSFEEIIKSIRSNGDCSELICDTYSHLDSYDVATMIDNQELFVFEFCQSLLSEKSTPAGNPVTSIKKCIDDLQAVCDDLDGALKASEQSDIETPSTSIITCTKCAQLNVGCAYIRGNTTCRGLFTKKSESK